MSVAEKAIILGSLIGVTGVGIYYTISNSRIGSKDKNTAYQKRLEILEKDNVKMLYSTMSFMYLEGYKKNELESFFTLFEILQLSKPNVVAIPISKNEFEEKYREIMKSPRFDNIMQRVEYFAKVRSEELTTIPELDASSLDKIYPAYFCSKNRCSVIYADKSEEEYTKLLDAKLKLKQLYSEASSQNSDIDLVEEKQREDLQKSDEEIRKDIFTEKRQDNYVEAIMQEINPKLSLFPTSMYKTVVAITEPEHMKGIAARWKNKFRAAYNHEVVEDEESEKKG